MTFTSVINSVLLILGPIFVTYFAFDLHLREDGQKTALMALLLNLGVQTCKLTCLALLSPFIQSVSSPEGASASLTFQWGQICLNTLLTLALET